MGKFLDEPQQGQRFGRFVPKKATLRMGQSTIALEPEEPKRTFGESSEGMKERHKIMGQLANLENIREKANAVQAYPSGEGIEGVAGWAKSGWDTWLAGKSRGFGGKQNRAIAEYMSYVPAFSAGIYKDMTGDTRLSDADAQARALPLLWKPDEPAELRAKKFDFIERALQVRKAMVESGEVPASLTEAQSKAGMGTEIMNKVVDRTFQELENQSRQKKGQTLAGTKF